MSGTGDERVRSLYMRAVAFAGAVMAWLLPGWWLVTVAQGDPKRLRAEIRHVVVHELAHHFGISDERLRELDRY